MILKNLEFKLLRKLKILNYLNVSKSVYFKNSEIIIPVINGIGYPNLFLKPNWLYLLAKEFFAGNGDTFIDVGANIGQTLIAVKAIKKEIQYIGFEPSTSCCYYLKKLIEINNITNCHVYSFALSDKLQESCLETNGDADPTGSMVENLRPSFFKQSDSIFALDYDSLNIQHKVGCIKIDIEGGELEALMGMQSLINRDRPYIICEILDSFNNDVLAFTQERAERVCKILKQQDYLLIQLVQNEETDQIVSFNEIAVIKIKQWDNDSLKFNDYIFFPSEKYLVVIDILTKLCL